MNKKRKWGIILIIIGLGIILFFLFFSSIVGVYEFRSEGGVAYDERWVGILGLEFPYKYPLVAGGIVALIGVGMICYSFFPEKEG